MLIKIHWNDWCSHFRQEKEWCKISKIRRIKNINVERFYWQVGERKIESRTVNWRVINTRFDWNKSKAVRREVSKHSRSWSNSLRVHNSIWTNATVVWANLSENRLKWERILQNVERHIEESQIITGAG